MEQPATPGQALIQAVNRMGSQGAMARLCAVSQTAVWKWLNESKQLPAEHVLKVEAATHVPRSDLRPDIYPRGLQDGVPFSTTDGVAAIGELSAGASPEWPVTSPDAAAAQN